MRDRACLDHGRADRDSRSRRHVRRAQVEVDVQLVARERPALAVGGDRGNDASAHQRELIRPPVCTGAPPVADEPVLAAQLRRGELSRSPELGRRTIIWRRPTSRGARRISSSRASSSAYEKCRTIALTIRLRARATKARPRLRRPGSRTRASPQPRPRTPASAGGSVTPYVRNRLTTGANIASAAHHSPNRYSPAAAMALAALRPNRLDTRSMSARSCGRHRHAAPGAHVHRHLRAQRREARMHLGAHAARERARGNRRRPEPGRTDAARATARRSRASPRRPALRSAAPAPGGSGSPPRSSPCPPPYRAGSPPRRSRRRFGARAAIRESTTRSSCDCLRRASRACVRAYATSLRKSAASKRRA